jgi:hypothetical protein
VAPRYAVLAFALLAWAIPTLLFPIIVALLAPFARIAVSKAVIGSGPRLLRRQIGATACELRLVPLSSYVSALGMNPYEDEDDVADALREFPPDRMLWRDAPRLRRTLAVVLAPRLATFAIASVLVGRASVIAVAGRAVVATLEGAVSPLSTVPTLLEDARAALSHDGAVAYIGLALAVSLGVSVFLLPGDLQQTLQRSTTSENAKLEAKLHAMKLLIMLAVLALWLVGTVAWLVRGAG